MRVGNSIDSETFEKVVAASFQTFGLELEPSTLATQDYTGVRIGAAQDTTGMHDFEITRMDFSQGNVPSGMVSKTEPAFGWRGMLDFEDGSIYVEMPGAVPSTESSGHVVSVEHVTSPNAVNSLMAALGRTPGVDALKLVRHDDQTDLPAALCVEWMPEKVHPVSGFDEWSYASHDLKPRDHVQSWIVTDKDRVDNMAETALCLMYTHGDAIYAEGLDLPEPVKLFVDSVDHLEGFTRPIVLAVGTIANVPGTAPEMHLEHLDNLVAHGSIDSHLGYVVRNRVNMFRALGMIEPDLADDKTEAARARITAEYIAYTAGLFITLEDIKPLEGETVRQRDDRLHVLQSLQTRYADLLSTDH